MNEPLDTKDRQIINGYPESFRPGMDIYFSADVETDGPIPGPYSVLSFALVYAGAFDGKIFFKPPSDKKYFYVELKPIAKTFDPEAMLINGLDRDRLISEGSSPQIAMTRAASWVREVSGNGEPTFVAYPLSFDWSWLYWYFVNFSDSGSPFGYSRCFDIKTAIAVKLGRTIAEAGRDNVPKSLKSIMPHTHNALDDAIEQAEIFANIFVLEDTID